MFGGTCPFALSRPSQHGPTMQVLSRLNSDGSPKFEKFETCFLWCPLDPKYEGR